MGFRANFSPGLCVQCSMTSVQEPNSVTIERLRKQGGFLLRMYWAELAKDPASREAESSRSNLIAMQHTAKQMYGDAVARDVASLGTPTAPHLYEQSEG
jgi:hypothetical protein